MSDDLIVSGGGSAAVATDELYGNAQLLRSLAAEAASLRFHLASIDALVSMNGLAAGGSPASAARAELDIDQARIILAEIEAQARVFEWALGTAADGYGFVERFIAGLGSSAGGALGALLGQFLPVLGLAAAPALSALAGGLLIASASTPGGVQALARENNRVLTNPLTASLIRQAVMSSDDLLMGASGIPRPVATLLGDNGLGIVGLGFTALSAIGLGSRFGLLAETRVSLASTRTSEGQAPPSGFSERLARVPDPQSNGGSQVVVERYSTPGQPDRFEVYVAGTVTFSPQAASEPWDMTSNMANAVGEGSGSYDSVVEAMRLAGVQNGSPVQFTGYSQGGATAALLAASGDYNTVGLATFGAPTGQIELPDTFPTVIVEHLDDIVPALGGAQVNQHAVIVERDVFGGRDIPTDHAVPAHHYEYYQETAKLMDGARSEQITDVIARLDGFGATATTVTSTSYRFIREPSRAAG